MAGEVKVASMVMDHLTTSTMADSIRSSEVDGPRRMEVLGGLGQLRSGA